MLLDLSTWQATVELDRSVVLGPRVSRFVCACHICCAQYVSHTVLGTCHRQEQDWIPRAGRS